ncbi:TBC1 domain family member 2b [Plakobranchus ocellatus]|uniref:TBC1 domain family member 2b n=1 Tax=Plakobranchus ocellatus TaxID=259542 RepID=A0AAV3YG14_9GAST|nr:TBC1 domain family member 2b [Plakobranchus ocellatus]
MAGLRRDIDWVSLNEALFGVTHCVNVAGLSRDIDWVCLSEAVFGVTHCVTMAGLRRDIDWVCLNEALFGVTHCVTVAGLSRDIDWVCLGETLFGVTHCVTVAGLSRDIDWVCLNEALFGVTHCVTVAGLSRDIDWVCLGRDRSLVPSEAWSLIDERPPASASLRMANETMDRTFSQTQWHVDLSDTLSSSSPHGSTEELIDLNLDLAGMSAQKRRISNQQTSPAADVKAVVSINPLAANTFLTSNTSSSGENLSSNTHLTPSSSGSFKPTIEYLTVQSPSTPGQSKPRPPQNLSISSSTASPQVISPQVISPPSPSPAGKSKFMSALRNLKIAKEPAKEKPKPAVNERHNSTGSDTSVGNFSCYNCKMMQEDLRAMENELQAHKEITRMMQKEVDFMQAQIKTRDECGRAGEAGTEEVLRQRDKHILELEYCCQELREEKRSVCQDLSFKSREVKELQDQISMFQQTLAVKDEMIVSLTNEIQDMQAATNDSFQGSGGHISPSITANDFSLAEERRELETLRDTCRAYEAQNRFLTSEILEQKALRENDEAREKVYIMNVASLEAKYYKTLSKYLFLLDEVKAPVRGGDESKTQDVVNRLLEEALDSEFAESTTDGQDGYSDKKAAVITIQGKEYDDFGFLKHTISNDGSLPSRAKLLEYRSNELEYMIRDADDVTSKKIKWENFIVGLTHSGKCLVRSLELKTLLRLGVPREFREKIWKGCIDLHIKSDRIKLGDNYYRDLQERAQVNKSNPAIKQIELDLLRTLPDNCFFQKIDSEGVCKLRRVLLCYSVHNPCIGYCQGINRIAAIALLFLREEDAFWCLVAIIDHIMPGDYYTPTLADAQADQRVLKDLMAEKCPRLHAHLELHEIDLSLFTFNWFLTIFVDGIYPELFLNIWDVFLYEGSKVLFRFGLAFLKYAEEDILNLPNNLSINRYMRTLGTNLTDIRRIQSIAFGDLNPFPMRNVTSKRQYHLQQVKAELEELEAIRKDLRSSHEAEEDGKGYISDDDMDDDGP